MRDYGKNVTWPAPPLSVRSVVGTLRAVHARWRAWMILRAVPRAEWPQLRLKVWLHLKGSSYVLFVY